MRFDFCFIIVWTLISVKIHFSRDDLLILFIYLPIIDLLITFEINKISHIPAIKIMKLLPENTEMCFESMTVKFIYKFYENLYLNKLGFICPQNQISLKITIGIN